jgi:hypothetical protein
VDPPEPVTHWATHLGRQLPYWHLHAPSPYVPRGPLNNAQAILDEEVDPDDQHAEVACTDKGKSHSQAVYREDYFHSSESTTLPASPSLTVMCAGFRLLHLFRAYLLVCFCRRYQPFPLEMGAICLLWHR